MTKSSPFSPDYDLLLADLLRSLRPTAPFLPLQGLQSHLDRWEAGRLTPRQWNVRFLPQYFARFGPADFHLELDRALHNRHRTRGQKLSLIAPRGGAKSTWCTLAYPLRCALERWEPYALILSDSAPQAVELLRHVRAELEQNPLLAAVYADAMGKGPEWRGNRLRLRNGAVIEALGTGSKVRGRRNRSERPSLVVFDDVQSNADMASPALRARAWAWATRDVLPAGDERTNFLAVGSALHREAVSVRLGQLAGWTGRTYPAIRAWPARADLWDEFERLATNLADDGRESTARAFYARRRAEMDGGAAIYWPARFGIADLMLKRAEIGAVAFESEYQGTPGAVEGAEWPSEFFTRADFYFETWPGDIVLKVQALDPSKGASGRADFQAHVLVALARFGTLYVDCELRREPGWVERAIDLAQVWNPAEVIAEANNTMGLMRPAAERILKERAAQGRAGRLNYTERINSAPKPVRIRRLSDYLRRNQIRVRNSPGGRLLVDQLRDWPNGAHDDGPDALATAVIRLEELAGG
jgi:hypothetical protein